MCYTVNMERVLEKNQKQNLAIRREVAKVFREVFTDPDFGLELRPEFVRRMKKSQKSGRSRSLRDFLKK